MEAAGSPRLSIVTACYNAADTLPQTLDSVQNQCTQWVEHLLVDGGSTDGSIDIANCFSHIAKVVSEPDRGIYDAMNKGIVLAQGDIVGTLNADDFYATPDVLKKVLEVFQDPTVDACYGDLCYVDCLKIQKIVRYWKSDGFNYRRFYWGWMPPHPTFFVRKRAYEQYGLFNLDLGSAADYELMLRFLVKHRINARYIPAVLVKMRTGGVSNASFGNRILANRMDRKAWQVNDLQPYPWTLALKPLRKIGQWIMK